MALIESYPSSGHDVSPMVVLLSDHAERERLSPGALRAFFRIMDRWKVRDEDARGLLGGVSNGTYYSWKRDSVRVLEEDRLRRISYLVGIFKALHILYGEKLADSWMKMANTNRIFGGRTPLDYLLRNGMPAFETVRRLLDARRGGQ